MDTSVILGGSNFGMEYKLSGLERVCKIQLNCTLLDEGFLFLLMADSLPFNV